MSSIGASDQLDVSRHSKGRLPCTFSADRLSTTMLGTKSMLSSVVEQRSTQTRLVPVVDPLVPSNISPCPLVERLRSTAVEDRALQYVRRQEHQQQAREREERKVMMDCRLTMEEYFQTLFWPTPPHLRPSGRQGKGVFLPALQGPMTKAKEKMILESLPKSNHREVVQDISNYFVGAYYKENPEALVRKQEAEVQRARLAEATKAAAARGSPARVEGRSQSLKGSHSRRSRSGEKRRKKKEVQLDGSPAANLQLLQSALLTAADSRGAVTLEAFLEMFRRAPFEVKDDEAVENFFSVIRPSPFPSEPWTNMGGRLETSHNTPTVSSMGQVVFTQHSSQPPQGSSNRIIEGSGGGQVSLSSIPIAKVSPVAISNRSGQIGQAASVSVSVPVVNEPLQQMNAREAHVRELLAGFDALVNGVELRDVIRRLCFSVLESDDYIHKVALCQLRRDGRESCEAPESILSPSIVKAARDCLDVLNEEEELAYVRSQLKGKKKKSSKAILLLPHQKTIIPLNMMRRSHISYVEFCRFFDTLPFLVAAFAHMWLPAFFARTWPRRRRGATYSMDGEDQDTDDECSPPTCLESTDDGAGEDQRGAKDEVDWEKVADAPLSEVLSSALKRRHMASIIVANRLAFMNSAAESPSPEPEPTTPS